MSRTPKAVLPESPSRMTYEQQEALVPKIFRPYWRKLARKNGYYNHTFMRNWADGLENERVLDAGCGKSSELTKREPAMTALVGIDPGREDLLENSRIRWRVQGVLEDLPFTSEVFSGYFSDSVYEHIEDPRKVCREAYRVLKPGGRVLINTNSIFNPFMFPNKFLTIRQREWLKRKLRIESEGTFRAPYRINTRRRLIKYLRSAGFVNIQIYRWQVPAMYRPRWVLVLLLIMALIAETPLFCGLQHRLMATAEKPK